MRRSGDTARLDGGEEIIAILVRLDHFILASPAQFPLAPLLNPVKGKPVLIVEANLNASIRLLVVTPRGKHGHVLAPVRSGKKGSFRCPSHFDVPGYHPLDSLVAPCPLANFRASASAAVPSQPVTCGFCFLGTAELDSVFRRHFVVAWAARQVEDVGICIPSDSAGTSADVGGDSCRSLLRLGCEYLLRCIPRYSVPSSRMNRSLRSM